MMFVIWLGNIMTGKRSRLNRESAGNTTSAVMAWPSAAYVTRAPMEMRTGAPWKIMPLKMATTPDLRTAASSRARAASMRCTYGASHA